MDISKEEFESQFTETLDTVIQQMADHEEVGIKEFYTMACILENLSFFSPVIYGLLKKTDPD